MSSWIPFECDKSKSQQKYSYLIHSAYLFRNAFSVSAFSHAMLEDFEILISKCIV